MKDAEKEKKRERRWSLGLGVKSSIYPLDEKQTAIGAAQTRVSSLGIGLPLVAHQAPSFSFSVQMEGKRWRWRTRKKEADIYISLG